MSNAPVSLATTAPNALPPPSRRRPLRPSTAKNPQCPDDIQPILYAFYMRYPEAREEWAKELAERPMERRASVKAKKKVEAFLPPPRVATVTKECAICGAVFESLPNNAWRQEYCSARCRDRGKTNREREEKRLAKDLEATT
jgi:endogenous inhibitor of DNA gyrase (YacG/DUF329 family)